MREKGTRLFVEDTFMFLRSDNIAQINIVRQGLSTKQKQKFKF